MFIDIMDETMNEASLDCLLLRIEAMSIISLHFPATASFGLFSSKDWQKSGDRETPVMSLLQWLPNGETNGNQYYVETIRGGPGQQNQVFFGSRQSKL
jgi:hypothetical protein